nr:hypothetical protein [Tanacetum cinerariifolium]
PIAPTTIEQGLAKKNELKARGTLLMALPDKHQLKFNIHKDDKSLMEDIEKRYQSEILEKLTIRVENSHSDWRNKADLEDQSLDDLFNNLKIYEAEAKSSSSTSHNTQNIAFVSSQNIDSTNESVSVVTSVSVATTKPPASILPKVDNLSDVVIYSFFASQSNSPQLENDDLKQINVDDLEEMNLKWQMAMLTMRARRRGHFARECRSPKDTRNKDAQRRSVPVETSTFNALISQCDGVGSYDWSFQADKEPTNYALMAITSSSSSSSDNETSSKNLSKLLASQITDKTGLGYDTQFFHSKVFASDELTSSESDVTVPTSPVHARYKSSEGYHAVPPSYTGTFMPHKLDLIFHDAPTVSETVPIIFNIEFSTTQPIKEMSQSNRPSAPIIEDWVSDSEDESESEPMPTQKAPSFVQISKHVKTPRTSVKPTYARMTHPHSKKHVVPTAVLTRSRLVPLNTARPVTPVVPQPIMKHQRLSKHVVNKPHSPIRRPINHRPSLKNSNVHQKVTTVKTKQVNAIQGTKGNWGNPQQALKDKGVIDSGCSRHMTGNISYLFDFKEINGGYVKFGGNPKGGIKREFSVARTPQQNRFAKRKNKTLIEAARTMLADSLLPIPFWAEAVNIACYVQNRVLVIKPHNKTPYELLLGRTPSIEFMRPFGCPVTILNTLDTLGKFDRKANEVFLVGYFVSSKAFRVFNSRTRIVQETLHINFLENQPNVSGSGPTWLFDIDTLTQSMNYQPVVAVNQPNSSTGIQENLDAGKEGKESISTQQYVLLQLWSTGSKDPHNTDADAAFADKQNESEVHVSPSNDEEDVGAEANFSNLETNITISLIPTTRVHKERPVTQIIIDLSSAPQTRSMTRVVKDQGGLTQINDEDFHTCMFACFLSQEEPKRVHQALKDPSWIEAMKKKLLQFKMQKVWVLIDLPKGKRVIGSKWVFRNKKDERGIVIKIKARLVAQGHTQEEGIDYEEVFSSVARIEAIRLLLTYASFMGFMVYQMDVKSAFLYGTIKEEVYVCQPPGYEDPDYPDKNGFQRGKIDQTLFIKKQKGDILLVHVYVDDIIFGSTNKELCKAFEKLMKD